jgi:hypothetical protein
MRVRRGFSSIDIFREQINKIPGYFYYKTIKGIEGSVEMADGAEKIMDSVDLFLIALTILLFVVETIYKYNFTRGTYLTFFLCTTGIIVALYALRYLSLTRDNRKRGESSPHVWREFILPVLRKVLILFGTLTVAVVFFEIWMRYIHGQPIPEYVLFIQFALILTAYCYYRIYKRMKYGTWDAGLTPVQIATIIGKFFLLVFRFFTHYFGKYIAVAILFNGCLALVVLLAGTNTIQLDLSHTYGNIVFLVYGFGNLVLFALVMLKLERLGRQPVSEEGNPSPDTNGSSKYFWHPRWSTTMMAVLIAGFLVAFFAAPILAVEYIKAGSQTPDKVINVTVDQSDPSQVIVMYNGGKDAGQLILLEAEIYDPKGEYITRSFLGSDTSITPISIGQRMTFSGPLLEGSKVIVSGHFFDGKKQQIVVTYV